MPAATTPVHRANYRTPAMLRVPFRKCECEWPCVSALALLIHAGAITPSLADATGLGFLPDYGKNSYSFDISADGSAAVGYATNAATFSAFRWTDTGGMTAIGPAASAAQAISADGQSVVGYFYDTDHTEAFVWTEGGGFNPLGVGGFTESYADGISANGNYVVGRLRGGGQTKAFAWTSAEGIIDLGYLEGGRPYSAASDVSNDGIITGWAQMLSGSPQAFYKDLTDPGAIQGLGYLAGGSYSLAHAITPDAGTIVGAASNAADDVMAVRWLTTAPGYSAPVVLAGVEGWAHSEAKGISADGSIAVGSYKTSNGSPEYRAFRWTEAGGAESLDAWLTGTGVDTTGWIFDQGENISDDGTTVVGSGRFNSTIQTQGYIARAGVVVGTTDYSESVESLSELLRLPSSMSLARVGGVVPASNGLNGLSITALYDHVDGSASDLGGALLTWRQPGLEASVGGGLVSVSSALSYQNGSTEMHGGWVGAGGLVDVGKAFNFAAFDGLQASFGVRADMLGADIRRVYLNGATAETASGTTDVTSLGTQLRIGWELALADNASVTPFAQWQHAHAQFGAYSETGGAGAGSVSGASSDTDIVSAGASLDIALGQGIDLSASYAFNHMTGQSGSDITVTVPSLASFVAPGSQSGSDWHTLGAGVGWSPTEQMRLDATASVNFGSSYPENWTVGTRLSFGL